MMRFMLSAGVAVVGLTLLAASEARADGPSGGGSGHPSYGRSGEYRHDSHHFDYRFPSRPYQRFASNRFGYDRYGYRSLSWSNYRWSSDYRCYVYWAPTYRSWFFYEPTFSYYVPVTHYREVYPEFSPTVTTVPTTPSVIQQTSVVVAAPTPVGPIAESVPPGPIPPVAPAPTAVQNTKVGPGAL